MLDILINHYQEPSELIEHLLRSIEDQNGLDLYRDVHVTICTDGMDCRLPDEFLQAFLYPITYYRKPHSGVCATRNYLLDKTDGDYVMFCDADDMFHDNDGLLTLSKSIEKLNPDVIGSCYLAETKRNGRVRSYPVSHDILHLQGMAFKRSYIRENDIRFPDEMQTSGDMYFLWLVFHLTKNVQWISDCFYTWKWNPESVTRACEHYDVKNYPRMVQNYTLLTENVIARDNPELVHKLVVTCILTFFIDEQSGRLAGVPESYILAAKDAIHNYVCVYRRYYEEVPEESSLKTFWTIMRLKCLHPSKVSFQKLQEWIKN